MISPFSKIAFVGFGMMAGSMAKLIHQLFPAVEIYAVNRSSQGLEMARKEGVIVAGYSTIDQLPTSLDLVIVATPISVVNEALQTLSMHVESPCLFTDIASVKCTIGEGITLKSGQVFIGGHPMAGKTGTGYVHAEVEMLKGALYLLTQTDSPQLKILASFLENLGFRVMEIDAETHDRLLASASHMPFIMAALTVGLSQEAAEDVRFKSIISTGFRDTTRVASGSPEWAVDICEHNKANLLQKLKTLKANIGDLEHLIETGNKAQLMAYFSHLKNSRDALYS